MFTDFSWRCDHCFSCSDMNLSQCWYQSSFFRSFTTAQFHFQKFVMFNRPTPIPKTTTTKQINSVNGSIVSHLQHETRKQPLSRWVFLTQQTVYVYSIHIAHILPIWLILLRESKMKRPSESLLPSPINNTTTAATTASPHYQLQKQQEHRQQPQKQKQ